MEECCGNCKFGKPRKENVKEIDCHRYPSQVTAILVQNQLGQPQPVYLNATPVMEGADWCGEYQPKKSLVS